MFMPRIRPGRKNDIDDLPLSIAFAGLPLALTPIAFTLSVSLSPAKQPLIIRQLRLKPIHPEWEVL